MNKLYVVLSTIFVHILFTMTVCGTLMSIYFAARGDKSMLIIAGLCVLANQCVKGLWYFTKLEWKEMQRYANEAKRNDESRVRKISRPR